jgi:DNA-binding transcriptional LysR family regulator
MIYLADNMDSKDDIDLNLLRVFDAIASERSLTRAGERLRLSQPAISYSLGRLRALFDDPLFVRTRTGMQPTPLATDLTLIIGRTLMTAREALNYAESFDPLTSTRTFRLSLSDAGELVYLPLISEALNRLAPHVKVQIVPLPIDSVEEGLRSSRIDFAIGNLPSLVPRTCHRRLFEEDYVCITRKRRGLPTGPEIDPAVFVAGRHVQVASPEHSHDLIEGAFQARGMNRDIVLEVPHFVALPKVLALTDHFATLPRRLADVFVNDGGLRMYELPPGFPTVVVSMHWHKNFDTDKSNVWLRDLIVDIIRGLDRP